ncbi:MAG: Gldg family protein [Candidatus Methanofastidiosia archaeon]
MQDVTSQDKKVLVFYTYTETEKIWGENYKTEMEFSYFITLLRGEGFDTETTYERITYERIREYDTVILSVITSSLKDKEIQALLKYINQGGSLLLLGADYAYYDFIEKEDFEYSNVFLSLNKLASNFGVRFRYDWVIDTKAELIYKDKRVGAYMNNFLESEMTKGVKTYGHFQGCSLKIFGNATPLAWSTTAFNEPGNSSEEKLISGMRVIGIAYSFYGNGKIVMVGAPLIIFQRLEVGDNKKFILNMMNWLPTGIEIPRLEELLEKEKKALEFFENENFEESLRAYEELLDGYKIIGDKKKIDELELEIQRIENVKIGIEYLEDAKNYFSEGKYSKSERLFMKAKEIFMENEAQKRIDEIEDFLSKIEIIKRADSYFERGKKYFDNEEYEDATSEFKKAREIYKKLNLDKKEIESWILKSELEIEKRRKFQRNLFFGSLSVVIIVGILIIRKKLEERV